MACACKNKVNRKYVDGWLKDDDDTNIISKIINRLLMFAMGIIVASIALCFMIPFLLWMVFCLLIGKEVVFSLPNIQRWFKRSNEN